MTQTIAVVAIALINANDEVMVAQRGPHESFAGQWEFPGGKIEPGETPQAALAREMCEELGFEVPLGKSLGRHQHAYETFTVEIEVFVGRYQQQTFRLTDHSAIRWMPIEDLERWPLAAADIPFVAKIRDYLRHP